MVLSWGWCVGAGAFLGVGGCCLDSGAGGTLLLPLEIQEVSLFQETKKDQSGGGLVLLQGDSACTEVGRY